MLKSLYIQSAIIRFQDVMNIFKHNLCDFNDNVCNKDKNLLSLDCYAKRGDIEKSL